MKWLVGAAFIFLFFAVPAVIAWLVARFLLLPKDVFDLRHQLGDKRDKWLSRLMFGRSALGFVSIVAITLPYRHVAGVTKDAAGHWAHTLQEGAYAAAGCILLLAAVARHRRRLFPGVLRPVLRFVVTIGALSTILPFLMTWPEFNRIINTQPPRVSGQGIPVLLTAVGMLSFVVASSYYAARYLYGAGELHPLLAPAVTIAAVVVITVVEIRSGLHQGPGDTPLPVLLMISATALATTTPLAVLEWRLIQGPNYNYTVREIPERATAPHSRALH